jgi:hypothetical protein
MMRRPMCETWGEPRLECCGSYDRPSPVETRGQRVMNTSALTARAVGADLGDSEDLLRGNACTLWN